jgi:two-component system nitrogen regulation response regulator NtrX
MDIPLLVNEFIGELCRKHAFKPLRFTGPALDILKKARWAGNVRELKNFVERMMILHAGSDVGPEQLPPEFEQAAPYIDAKADDIPEGSYDFKAARSEFEARFLKHKFNEFGGNISRMADAIGMERSYLYRKLRGYGIQISD